MSALDEYREYAPLKVRDFGCYTLVSLADAAISELEAQVQRDEKYRDELLERRAGSVERAEQAEAHAADCKRLVTACENDLDAERMKRREVEAKLAKLTQRNDELRSTLKAYLATIKRLEAKVADREASKAEAEAALAERDRMLRIAYGEASEYVGFMSPDEWFDFLRARAEEAKP